MESKENSQKNEVNNSEGKNIFFESTVIEDFMKKAKNFKCDHVNDVFVVIAKPKENIREAMRCNVYTLGCRFINGKKEYFVNLNDEDVKKVKSGGYKVNLYVNEKVNVDYYNYDGHEQDYFCQSVPVCFDKSLLDNQEHSTEQKQFNTVRQISRTYIDSSGNEHKEFEKCQGLLNKNNKFEGCVENTLFNDKQESLLEYRGFVKDGEKDVFGIEKKLGGHVYIGDWKGGKKDGIGCYYGPSGSYQGQFKNNKMLGLGTYNIEGNSTFEGYLREDERSVGVGENDIGIYEGEMYENCPHGYGKLTYKNSDFGVDEGYFYKGEFLGKANEVDKKKLKELGLDKPVIDDEVAKELWPAKYDLSDNSKADKSMKK